MKVTSRAIEYTGSTAELDYTILVPVSPGIPMFQIPLEFPIKVERFKPSMDPHHLVAISP